MIMLRERRGILDYFQSQIFIVRTCSRWHSPGSPSLAILCLWVLVSPVPDIYRAQGSNPLGDPMSEEIWAGGGYNFRESVPERLTKKVTFE